MNIWRLAEDGIPWLEWNRLSGWWTELPKVTKGPAFVLPFSISASSWGWLRSKSKTLCSSNWVQTIKDDATFCNHQIEAPEQAADWLTCDPFAETKEYLALSWTQGNEKGTLYSREVSIISPSWMNADPTPPQNVAMFSPLQKIKFHNVKGRISFYSSRLGQMYLIDTERRMWRWGRC